MLVCIEGIDRSGKTSQAKTLVEALKTKYPNTKVSYMSFPDRHGELMTGKPIHDFLARRPPSPTYESLVGDKETKLDKAMEAKTSDHDRAVHLLFSANRWEKAKEIREKLAQGEIIILDRYILSGLAYSTAKGLDMKWCARCEHGLPNPDLTILFKISPEFAATRADFGKERFDQVDFQTRVAAQFSAISQIMCNRIYQRGLAQKIIRLHLSGKETKQQVATKILSEVENMQNIRKLDEFIQERDKEARGPMGGTRKSMNFDFEL